MLIYQKNMLAQNEMTHRILLNVYSKNGKTENIVFNGGEMFGLTRKVFILPSFYSWQDILGIKLLFTRESII